MRVLHHHCTNLGDPLSLLLCRLIRHVDKLKLPKLRHDCYELGLHKAEGFLWDCAEVEIGSGDQESLPVYVFILRTRQCSRSSGTRSCMSDFGVVGPVMTA